MHVLCTGVPRRLGVASSASSPKAAQALGCSLTPGLRISFGRVPCMARAASVPGLWTLGFLLVCGVCVWGLGCAWARVSVTPPALAGVLGGCVWVRVVVSPLLFWLGFAVFAVWLGYPPAPLHSWLGFWGVRGCVRAPPVPRHSRFGCAVWACVLGFGFRLRPATPRGGVGVCVCLCARPAWSPAPPGLGCGAGICSLAWVAAAPRHSWLGFLDVRVFVCAPCLYPAFPGCAVRCGRVCWARVPAVPGPSWLGCAGVCAFLRVPRSHPAIPGGVVCVHGFGFRLLSGFPGFLAWVLGRVASCARRVRFLSPSGGPPVPWGCAGVAVGGVCPPPPVWLCWWEGGGWRVVSWLCGVGRWLSRFWVSWFPSPLPLSFGLRLCVFFAYFFPSRPKRGVCLRVRGVSSSVGLLLSVWCCWLWLGGPPVPFSGVLSCWLGGLAASCGVGGRFPGCGPFSCPPPLFLFRWGSACSSLCLPLAGARTGRHSVWSSGLLLVLAFC